MSNITPFNFEDHQVRVITTAHGETLFVASDVLSVLTLDRKALERLDDDEKGVSSIHTPGGAQDMTVVNEPGLYSLVLGSRKPEAKRFKRWVTHDVLPAIRKTGSYSVPPQHKTRKTTSITDMARVALMLYRETSKIKGVDKATMMAKTMEVISATTGDNYQPMVLALPTVAPADVADLNPTSIGQRVGMSAREVNQVLIEMGLQYRNDSGKLRLTDAGSAFGSMTPFHKNGHSDLQIHWKEEVVDLVRGHTARLI
jgi:prophage antirepressor-like protein